VAADDGIMPQTIEAINHAQAAKVPLIVAINKMDSVGADPEKIRNMLLSHNVVVEQFSGDVLSVEVSALKRQGLDELLEAVLLQADMMSLQANPNRSAMGTVVESKMEMGRGSVATVLVQHGTLKIGDVFITGQQWGKVRALFDDQGNKINQALPSSPVEVLGLNGSPSAGDDLIVVESEAKAREITDHRLEKLKSKKAAAMTNIEAMFSQIKDGQRLEVPVVIKADVHGSAEVIKSSLEKISNDEVKITAIHVSVGGITESDITLAKASNALVIAFNVRANAQAKRLAEQEQIDVRYYSIIYNLIDDVKDIISGKLEPERKEIFLGYAEIREVFNVSKVGKVAGCYVTEGEIKRGCNVRLLRDNVVIHEGSLKTLKRHKDEVKEVKHGYECGMGFENYQDIRNGDFIECFEIQEFARTLA
jgi:translation initiation factor IF-2